MMIRGERWEDKEKVVEEGRVREHWLSKVDDCVIHQESWRQGVYVFEQFLVSMLFLCVDTCEYFTLGIYNILFCFPQERFNIHQPVFSLYSS